MRSTFAGLNTMVRGIFANQLSLDTTGHNIVNAGTEGYSRQAVNLVTTRGQNVGAITGEVIVGTGVDAGSIRRARDIYADIQFRNETATQNYYETIAKNYDKIESVFDDSQGNGIQDAMARFYSSWVDLSANASSSANRISTVEQAKNFSNAIQSATFELQDQINQAYETIASEVIRVNEVLEGIVDANRLITAQEAGGGNANDLRDQRDLLADELATYMDIHVTETLSGGYQVNCGGIMLVNGADRLHLKMSAPVSSGVYRNEGQGPEPITVDYGLNDYTIKIEESNIVFLPQNGIFKAQFDTVDINKSYIDDLADMAAFMLTTFNDQHKQGYDMSGAHGQNFFGLGDLTYSYENGKESTALTAKYRDDDMTVVKTVDANGDVEYLTGIKIINALETNRIFDMVGGSAYVAATTAYTSEVPASDKVGDAGYDKDFWNEIPWGDRTGDGTNAVYISELFNISTETIISTGRANKLIFAQRDANGNVLRYQSGDVGNVVDGVTVTQDMVGEIRYRRFTDKLGGRFSTSIGDESLNTFYQSSMSTLGIDSASIDTRMAEQDAIMTQIQNWRDSTAGVDWNEELTNMIMFQKGYSSCARCLTAMDEMLDRLVNNTGVVGR